MATGRRFDQLTTALGAAFIRAESRLTRTGSKLLVDTVRDFFNRKLRPSKQPDVDRSVGRFAPSRRSANKTPMPLPGFSKAVILHRFFGLALTRCLRLLVVADS